MTPAEAKVIEEAIKWAPYFAREYEFHPIALAVDALEQERAEWRPYTWGQLTEGDQVFSEAKGRWYEVVQTSRNDRDTTVTVSLKGMPKPIVKYLGQECKVKRGSTGQAVDIVQVIFSGEARQ